MAPGVHQDSCATEVLFHIIFSRIVAVVSREFNTATALLAVLYSLVVMLASVTSRTAEYQQ